MTNSRGLTLIELLVTLVITSMVLALLMQMLDQGRQLEARMQRVSESASDAPWRMSLLREAVRGLLPGVEREPDGFRGDELGFSGATLAAPDARGSIAKLLRVRLVARAEGQQLQLEWAGPNQVLVVAQWTTRDGHMRYVDAQGVRHDQWPPAKNTPLQALPAAVLVLESRTPDAVVHVLPLVASPVPPTTQRQLETL